MPKVMKLFILVGSIITFVVLAYGAVIFFYSWPVTFSNVDKAGVFGDSFGVLTSLFSGLAFAGIIVSLIFQNKELELQRKELNDTRIELKLTRQQFEKQNTTLEKQQFENTFFQMVRLHHEIVGSTRLSVKDGRKGRECFQIFYHELEKHFRKWLEADKKVQNQDFQENNETIDKAYRSLYGGHQRLLGHYFRNLYTIFKFIKTSEVKDNRFYSNIVRAQLSDDELLLLFYNCLSSFGKEKFKPLTEEFSLFHNIPHTKLLSQEHKCLYAESAFGDMGPDMLPNPNT